MVGPVQRQPGKAYELWALPRGGQPVSLGLLPAGGTYERTLNTAQRAALLAADKVAVSVEPARSLSSRTCRRRDDARVPPARTVTWRVVRS